jgi:drug/metabolite transporter (DMT)-like permease
MQIFLFIVLTLLSSSVHLVESVLIKKYNQKYDKGGFIFTGIVSLFSMLFFIITDKGGFDFRLEMLPYGIIAGIFYCAASFLTFLALGCGPFALSKLILSYAGIFSICYGIFFLKDSLSIPAYIGIALMLVSLFLNKRPKTDDEKKASLKWLIAIILSVVGSGMYGVFQKLQAHKFTNEINNEFMIVALGFSAVTLFIIGIIKDGKDLPYILKHGTLYSSVAGISNGLTNLIILTTNQMLQFSIASPIRSGVGIIFSFIVSRLLFKEKFLPRQIVGVLLGAVALVLINIK